jgi:hypothetical protein
MASRPKKNFVLLEGNSDTKHVFASAQPRGAALKAASRGFTNIRLRERGTNRVHVFEGSVSEVDAPANRPDWLPARVKKANVKKQGVERL